MEPPRPRYKTLQVFTFHDRFFSIVQSEISGEISVRDEEGNSAILRTWSIQDLKEIKQACETLCRLNTKPEDWMPK